jgi:hypothetical protein
MLAPLPGQVKPRLRAPGSAAGRAERSWPEPTFNPKAHAPPPLRAVSSIT